MAFALDSSVDRLAWARMKLLRAKAHLKTLHKDLPEDSYGVVIDHEAETNELVMRAKMPLDLFVHASVLAGEIVYQARSSLEYAVWELVPNPIEGVTGFPCIWKEADYSKKASSMIRGIDDAAAAVIYNVQPFRTDGERSPLYLLNELWKRDKHRLLNFCLGYPAGIAILYRRDGGIFRDEMVSVPAGVEDGTELWRITKPPAEVEVIAEAAIATVAFTDAGPATGQPVPELLTRLVKVAEDVIEALAATL